MRTIEPRHPLAVLRGLIGLGQKDLAERVGCSRPTVQAVELGKLALSRALALKIEAATGVSAGWLLAGDTHTLPTDRAGKEYTSRTYEAVLAGLFRGSLPRELSTARAVGTEVGRITNWILEQSAEQDRLDYTVYRVIEDLKGVAKELGLTIPITSLLATIPARITDPHAEVLKARAPKRRSKRA